MDERHPDLAAGRRLLAEARAAADGPAWAIPLRRDAAEHWPYLHADALLDAADALGRERRRVAALEGALRQISNAVEEESDPLETISMIVVSMLDSAAAWERSGGGTGR